MLFASSFIRCTRTERQTNGKDKWKDGWLDRRRDGWTNGRTDRRTDEKTKEKLDGRADGTIDEWMDGRTTDGQNERRMDRRKDKRKDGLKNGGTNGRTDGRGDDPTVIVCFEIIDIIMLDAFIQQSMPSWHRNNNRTTTRMIIENWSGRKCQTAQNPSLGNVAVDNANDDDGC